jgi:hypothetical protein
MKTFALIASMMFSGVSTDAPTPHPKTTVVNASRDAGVSSHVLKINARRAQLKERVSHLVETLKTQNGGAQLLLGFFSSHPDEQHDAAIVVIDPTGDRTELTALMFVAADDEWVVFPAEFR